MPGCVLIDIDEERVAALQVLGGVSSHADQLSFFQIL